jgi:probable HAF family extracellular repeat protein
MLSHLILAVLAAPAQGYVLEDLGTLSATPTDGVRAASIDNLGRVHAENDKSAPGGGGLQWRSFLWTSGVRSEILPPVSGSTWSGGSNDAGEVVGYYTAFGAGGAALPLHGYIWRAGQPLEDVILGTKGFTRIFDINADGETCGAYLSDDLFGFVFQNHAFLRLADGSWQDLGTLGGRESRAQALNDRAMITGMARGPADEHHGFLWQAATGMIDLGHLGGTYCDPEDIDNHGRIVGASDDALGATRPFLWEGGVMRDLGTLGGPDGRAKGINEHGDIVGNAQDAGGVKRAVIWPHGGSPMDLNQFVAPGSGWDLTGAAEINELGEISGTGLLHGEQRAYRLSPILPVPRVSGFLPGLTGRVNTVRGLGFTPGATVEVYAGLRTGSTVVPCGAVVDIAGARLVGTAVADGEGRIALTRNLPPAASGRTVLLQAVETAGCVVGERLSQLLP